MDHEREHARCGSVPHVYLTAWAMWCGHRQAWTISWQLHTDTGDVEGSTPLVGGELLLGPFDGTAEALTILQDRLERVWPDDELLRSI